MLSYTLSDNPVLQPEDADSAAIDETAPVLQTVALGGYMPKEAILASYLEELSSIQYLGTMSLDGQFIRLLSPRGNMGIALAHFNEMNEQDFMLNYVDGSWLTNEEVGDANPFTAVSGDYLLLSNSGLEDLESILFLSALAE